MALLGFWSPCASTISLPDGCADGQEQPSDGEQETGTLQPDKGAGRYWEGGPAGAGLRHRCQLPPYPAGCKVYCLDPNFHFEKFLTKSMAENRHLEYERFVGWPRGHETTGHGSMDVVVSTLVLCSVQSPKRVLQEVRRVLRPGAERKDLGMEQQCGISHPRVQGTRMGISCTRT